MPKIKGWEKVKETKELTTYIRHDRRQIINIKKIGNRYGTQIITPSNIRLKDTKTKSEAEAFAIRWMRQHPRG